MQSAARRLIGSSSRALAAVLLIGLIAVNHGRGDEIDLVPYVNTLRGSNSTREYSHGNTFPAVSVPFGFNFWTPITEGNSSSWLYRYDRKTLQGFGVCHQPSPWIGDYASIQLMPQVGSIEVAPDARKASFRHEHETARPDYYSVQLDSSGIRVEMTPTDHASRFRFTFPEAEHAYVLFDTIDSASGELEVDPTRRSVEGHVDMAGPRLYLVAVFDQPIEAGDTPQGHGASAAARFRTARDEVVELALATSYLSVEQARANLEAEIGERSFDEIRQRAARLWERRLEAVEIRGATPRQKVTFYSNLYRVFMYPNSMWEQTVDGPRYFSPYDNQVHTGKIWVNNGFWDTYRAAWPLYLLLAPEAGEMLQGFVRAYQDGGWTPRWSGPGYKDSMVGTHTDAVFADAYLKGVRDFDVATAYQSALKNALVVADDGAHGRRGNELAIFRTYVPTSHPEAAAWSLENYVNDHAISKLATELGDDVHAQYFRSRALGYVDLFSREKNMFRGRTADGAWRTPDDEFRAHEWGHEFTEGNAWHYSLAANHDPQGMARLYGGRAQMAAMIDRVFDAPRDYLPGSYKRVIHEMREAYDTNMGQYAHANEPLHHMIYMYNYAGVPAKTQRRVRDVLDERRGLYSSGVGDGNGYLGDEDNGQMSAWFVFSALGFYPASPGHPEYAIGSPLYRRAEIRLANGNRFVVSAPRNSERNVYVQSATLNGRPLARNYLTHAEVADGGELELVMGPSPSSWGSGRGDVPTSLSGGDAALEPLRDQARGGVVTASSERPGHAAALAFDDDSRTEWLAPEQHPWIAYHFGQGPRRAIRLYTVTSGRGDPAADPKSWTLETSPDGVTWRAVDWRRDQTFTWRRQTRVFAVAQPSSGLHYRLRVEANGGARETRVAELELLWLNESDRASARRGE